MTEKGKESAKQNNGLPKVYEIAINRRGKAIRENRLEFTLRTELSDEQLQVLISRIVKAVSPP